MRVLLLLLSHMLNDSCLGVKLQRGWEQASVTAFVYGVFEHLKDFILTKYSTKLCCVDWN